MGTPSLAIQVLGDELKVEGLPCCTIRQPRRLLLLAGHDLKEHSNRRAFCLHSRQSPFVMLYIRKTICMQSVQKLCIHVCTPQVGALVVHLVNNKTELQVYHVNMHL